MGFLIKEKELKEFIKRKDIKIFDITNMSDDELIECGFLENAKCDYVGNVVCIAYTKDRYGLKGKLWLKDNVFYATTQTLYRFNTKG